MIWQQKTGTFYNKSESECFHKMTPTGIINLIQPLLIADHNTTLGVFMSHYLNVLVTYKEEANILYSAELVTWDRGGNPSWHTHICSFFFCFFVRNKEMGIESLSRDLTVILFHELKEQITANVQIWKWYYFPLVCYVMRKGKSVVS